MSSPAKSTCPASVVLQSELVSSVWSHYVPRILDGSEAVVIQWPSLVPSQGLLAQKVIHKQDHISTVNRGHELYSAAGASQAAGLSNGTEQRGGPDAAKASTSGSSPEPSARVEVSYCYRRAPTP